MRNSQPWYSSSWINYWVSTPLHSQLRTLEPFYLYLAAAKPITSKISTSAVPEIITRTETSKRLCGFALALFGLLYHCFRMIGFLIWYSINLSPARKRGLEMVLLFEGLHFSIGAVMFYTIIKDPKNTLETSNFAVRTLWNRVSYD